MAGAMLKAMVYLGLVEDEDRLEYDDYDQYDRDGDAGEDGHPEDRHSRAAAGSGDGPRALSPSRDGSSVATMPGRRPATQRSLDRITTIHPRTYNEAKNIGESFRDGTPVIMNLTDLDDSDAKRLVDFAAGLVFGLHGSIERVTSKVFLLSPAHVEVMANEVEPPKAASRGFFNQS
jgi:cell division inhibitor SepF